MFSHYQMEKYLIFNIKQEKKMNNDNIYEKLKNNLINELNLFDEDELLEKIEKNKFSKNIIYHSKSL